eukprot:6212076-Pleurochrysis_carterae.AAC.3
MRRSLPKRQQSLDLHAHRLSGRCTTGMQCKTRKSDRHRLRNARPDVDTARRKHDTPPCCS